jgi:hypothetical protein
LLLQFYRSEKVAEKYNKYVQKRTTVARLLMRCLINACLGAGDRKWSCLAKEKDAKKRVTHFQASSFQTSI